MKKDDIFSYSHVYFIGIGGISMSGLAKILLFHDKKVSGSDHNKSEILDELTILGAKIFPFHSKHNISEDIDLVVFSGAIDDTNSEMIQAKELQIEIVERSEFLGKLSQTFQHVIAISGTHGKTTTTAMIGCIFEAAGLSPSIHLGGVSNNLGSNTIIGGQEYFIVEACEYRNSFNYLSPDCAVITNIEFDHVDYYKNIDNLYTAFKNFSIKSNHLIMDQSCNIAHLNSLIIGRDIVARNIEYKDHQLVYDVYIKNVFFDSITLSVSGEYNIQNSLYAIAVALYYNIDKECIVNALSQFKGVERRNENIGKFKNVPVIIDYAHHPTEIKNFLQGLSLEYSNPLIIFQPHTYTRTRELFDDFVSVLSMCKNLILYPTYSAREKEIVGGRSEDLFDNLNCMFISSFPLLIYQIKKLLSQNSFDCICILGAGDLALQFKDFINKNIKKCK